MNRKRCNCESRPKGAQAIDVVYHRQEDGRRESGVRGKALEIVGDGNAGRSAGVEACKSVVC